MADVDTRDLNVLKDVEAHVRLWERYGVAEITLPTEHARFLLDALTRRLASADPRDVPLGESAGDTSAYLH